MCLLQDTTKYSRRRINGCRFFVRNPMIWILVFVRMLELESVLGEKISSDWGDMCNLALVIAATIFNFWLAKLAQNSKFRRQ